MELIKDLPEVFEEFAEQRQKSFLAVKELKEKGVPVVGSYCTYFPKEIAMAMGAGCVSLCSTSDETIPEAEKDLPKNLCPLIKSSYGFAKTDKCPFFYFSDVVVGETTCDGKKKMYEYMSEIKDMHVMENMQFNPKRKGIVAVAQLPLVERDKRIKENPDYGKIICRCEEISKGEIIDALNAPLRVETVDGIKRRARPGMGRCQGGFCLPLVMEIIHEYTGKEFSTIKKSDNQSCITYGSTKEALK